MNYIGLLKEYLNLEPQEKIPEESEITIKQFDSLFEVWLPTQGENKGKGLFGSWARYASRTKLTC